MNWCRINLAALLIALFPGLLSSQTVFQKHADPLVSSYAAADRFWGTVLVAHDGRIEFEKAYGTADIVWNVPTSMEAKYEIASLTKAFTAMAIVQLEADGKLKVTDPVAKYYLASHRKRSSRLGERRRKSRSSPRPNLSATTKIYLCKIDHSSGWCLEHYLPALYKDPASTGRRRFARRDQSQYFGFVRFDPLLCPGGSSVLHARSLFSESVPIKHSVRQNLGKRFRRTQVRKLTTDACRVTKTDHNSRLPLCIWSLRIKQDCDDRKPQRCGLSNTVI